MGIPTASPRAVPTWFGTAGSFWALCALGMVASSIGPSLPLLAQGTGVTLGAVGIVFAAYRGGYVLGSLAGGAGLDRLPGNRMVAASLLVMAGAMVMVPRMASLPLLVVVYLVVGLGGGALEVGGNTLILWRYRENAGPWMNALHFAFGIGAMLMPAMVGLAVRTTGTLNPAFLAGPLIMLPGLLLLVPAADPSRPQQVHEGSGADDRVAVVLVAVFLLLYIGAEAGFGGWIYSWALRVHGVDPAGAAALTSLFWGALMTGRLLAIPVSRRVAPQVILVVSALVGAANLALLSSPVGSSSAAVLWISTAGSGLAMAPVFPSAMAWAGRHLHITGKRSSWFFIGAGVGGMSIPWALGHVMDRVGDGALMPSILGVQLLMGGVLAALVRRNRHG